MVLVPVKMVLVPVKMVLVPDKVLKLLQSWPQEGDLVTLLEADRSPAGLPPLPAHQVTTVH